MDIGLIRRNVLILITWNIIYAGVSGQCDSGWSEYTGYCYYVTLPSVAVNWTTANEKCHEMDSNLTSIRSKEENEFLLSITNTSRNNYWLGLHGKGQFNRRTGWRWTDGSSYTYAYWHESRTTGPGLDCVQFDSNGDWQNVYCYETSQTVCADITHVNCIRPNGYICKKKITITTKLESPTTTISTEPSTRSPTTTNAIITTTLTVRQAMTDSTDTSPTDKISTMTESDPTISTYTEPVIIKQSSASTSSKDNLGLYIGVPVGGAVLLIIIVAVAVACVRSKKKKQALPDACQETRSPDIESDDGNLQRGSYNRGSISFDEKLTSATAWKALRESPNGSMSFSQNHGKPGTTRRQLNSPEGQQPEANEINDLNRDQKNNEHVIIININHNHHENIDSMPKLSLNSFDPQYDDIRNLNGDPSRQTMDFPLMDYGYSEATAFVEPNVKTHEEADQAGGCHPIGNDVYAVVQKPKTKRTIEEYDVELRKSLQTQDTDATSTDVNPAVDCVYATVPKKPKVIQTDSDDDVELLENELYGNKVSKEPHHSDNDVN